MPRVLADAPARAPPERPSAVVCDRVSCGSSGGLVALRFRVEGVQRCPQSHQARSGTRVAVLYFYILPPPSGVISM